MSTNNGGASLFNTDEVYSGGSANLDLSGLNHSSDSGMKVCYWPPTLSFKTTVSKITTGLHSDWWIKYSCNKTLPVH